MKPNPKHPDIVIDEMKVGPDTMVFARCLRCKATTGGFKLSEVERAKFELNRKDCEPPIKRRR